MSASNGEPKIHLLSALLRTRRLLLAFLLFATVFPVQILAQELEVGIFPRRPPAETRIVFSDLIDYLERKTGMRVHLDTPADFESFEERLQSGQYDLVHLNQYHYIRAHMRSGYQAILQNEEFGSASIGAVIWIRTDSGINSVKDLKGKRILFGGGRGAMVSYIMAADLLAKNGLAIHDYQTQFGFHPIRTLVSLYYNQGAAAGSGSVVLKLAARAHNLDPSKIKALLRGPKFSHLPWAVSPGLDDQQRETIKQALLNLNNTRRGRAILGKAKLTGIRPATDSDYDPHRKIVARVLGEHYQ